MDRLSELEAGIGGCGSAIIAFSGGVDSSLVAAVAGRVLGERALAVTAVSPALARGELDGARAVARAIGVRHTTIRTDELARPAYRANARDRCYHCKIELYTVLSALARTDGFAMVLSGANADDVGDWRPGLRAAAEHDVRHPLLEAGLGKAEIRRLARRLRIPSADKPASPCLASRVPYGTPVDHTVLGQIDRAESALHALGFRIVRVRHFGATARVELGSEELERVRSGSEREAVTRAVKRAGYASIEIDPAPFRSGSMNRVGRHLPIVAT